MAEKGDWPSAVLSVHAFLQTNELAVGDRSTTATIVTSTEACRKKNWHTSIGEELEFQICVAGRMFMFVLVAIVMVVVVFPSELDGKMFLGNFSILWPECLCLYSNIVFVDVWESVVM